MGKSYVENSLKRFLKRKVKITLGLVVTFMITGAVAFGAEEGSIIEGNGTYISHDIWLDGIGTQENILKEDIKIGNDVVLSKDIINNNSALMSTTVKQNIKNVSLLIAGKDVKLETDNGDYNSGLELKKANSGLADNNILRADGKGTISVNGKDWTGELKDAEEIDGKDTGKGVQTAINGGKAVNYGNITIKYDPDKNSQNKGWGHSGQTARKNSEVYNYGTMTSREMVQRAELNSSAYNYGTLIGTHVQYAGNNGRVYNYGTIKTGSHGQNILNDSLAVNYGIIIGAGESGQGVNGSNSILKNYGVIATDSQRGQNSVGTENIKIYNYGIIANKGNKQLVGLGQVLNSKNGSGFNYGLIINDGHLGQRLAGENSEIYNYGLIANKGKAGQEIQGKNNTGYNYGIIANSDTAGQYAAGDKGGNKAINYGIIANVGNDGQLATAGAIAENYGIIANTGGYGQKSYGVISEETLNILNNGIINNNGGYGMYTGDDLEHKGENNGIVFNYINKPVLYGNITNNGVTIVKDTGSGEYSGSSVVENGIRIDAKDKKNIKISRVEKGNIFVATNQIENIVKEKKFTGGTLAENTNLFVDRYTKDKLTETVTLDNKTLTGNHITTVVGSDDNSDKTVISTNNDLTLNNSTIIGYFEKDGTLLEVNGNLTLTGNSVINAIAGNKYTGYKGNPLDNVIAVKLDKKGILTIEENSKVLGKVEGKGMTILKNSTQVHNKGYNITKLEILTTRKTNTTINKLNLQEGLVFSGHQTSKDNTKVILGNNIDIKGGISFNETNGEILGADITLGDGQTSSDKTINIDSITLGTENDVLTIKNILGTVGEINGNGGKDIVKLEKSAGDTFDYKLKNIDTLDLGNSIWKIGANADVSHGTTTKAGEKTTIQNGTLTGELKGTAEKGIEFINNEAVNKVIGNSTFGENAKFQMNIGKDMKLEAGAEYNLDDTTKNNLAGIKDKVTASAIFTTAKDDTSKELRVKSAKEMNIDERYSGIYEEMLKNASSNSEILDTLNNSDVSSIANAINGKGALGDTLATTGYKITRDISNSFMSAVNEWGKKANKGEWLANAKYINSDVEYDGANKVKGYDSDIKSMVGMIEYGVSDNTSLGIALGGGDTEIDVKDAGTLKGDNYYIGAYAKHSVNGFDLTGNLGYTISDLEVNREGSADSSAITLGGYIKRDIALTETVRLEPNLSFTYDYIMQDNAEGSGVKADNKDIHVFEAGAGMNIVKGFNFEKGLLELEAGVKYSMADVNRNEETVISVYGIDNINLGNPEIDKTRGTAHVGFDYEHTTGFGVNGKYETMWSDSGDDSRITAGISYRF